MGPKMALRVGVNILSAFCKKQFSEVLTPEMQNEFTNEHLAQLWAAQL